MKKSVAAVAILLIAALGFLGYIGYLGGPVFRLVPARGNAHGTVAVLVSGDLGFRIGMGPEIADRIAAHGIPVIGVNALTYFRTERTTDEATTLLSQAIARARALPGARRVVVIGQSFGADMVQHVFARLPQAVRRDIPLLVLTVPADSTAMQAMPAGLFGYGSGVPSLATARRIADVPVLCIHGAEETDSLCPLWRAANVTRVALPGGHPLHRDPDAVATTILTAIARTVAPR